MRAGPCGGAPLPPPHFRCPVLHPVRAFCERMGDGDHQCILGEGELQSRQNPRRQNPWDAHSLPTSLPGTAWLFSRTNLTLLPGHGVEGGRFLLHVLAAALGAFRVYFVFFQSENQFERFATIVADVVIHGHEGLPLDCDYELRLELYADTGRLSVCNPALQDTWDTRRLSGPKGGPFASL